MTRCGFTLIELLLMVSLTSLAVMITFGNLSSTTASAEMRSRLSRLIELDQRARVLAMRGERASLDLSNDKPSFRLIIEGDPTPLATLLMPEHVHFAPMHNRTSLEHVYFDQSGRSGDYTIVLLAENDIRTLRVLGLTGGTKEPTER